MTRLARLAVLALLAGLAACGHAPPRPGAADIAAAADYAIAHPDRLTYPEDPSP